LRIETLRSDLPYVYLLFCQILRIFLCGLKDIADCSPPCWQFPMVPFTLLVTAILMFYHVHAYMLKIKKRIALLYCFSVILTSHKAMLLKFWQK